VRDDSAVAADTSDARDNKIAVGGSHQVGGESNAVTPDSTTLTDNTGAGENIPAKVHYYWCSRRSSDPSPLGGFWSLKRILSIVQATKIGSDSVLTVHFHNIYAQRYHTTWPSHHRK